MATVIAVANQKGGVGKTTTTANLGAALALRGRRVLLVDLDPQGNLTSAFGLEKDVQQTIAESLLDRRVPLPVVPVANGAARETQPGRNLAVVPAAVGLASAEAQLMNKLGRELRLRDQLLSVEDSYDYVMIDTPPSLGVLTINALVAATRVIIPTEARFFSLQGLQMLEESIEEILYLNPRLSGKSLITCASAGATACSRPRLAPTARSSKQVRRAPRCFTIWAPNAPSKRI
jgi:chromosome partitioning protein